MGVTVLQVMTGDIMSIMTHQKWPLSECFFAFSGRSLTDTLHHFASLPEVVDPDAYMGGIQKPPYRFVSRKRRESPVISMYTKMTVDSEIRQISAEKCCDLRCCQLFPWSHTRSVRQLFYLKEYQDRREYCIAAGGQFHSKPGVRLKFMTLMGLEVCTTAWYKIHGIAKSTFHGYIRNFKEGVLSGQHGNKGIKRPRIGTVQAMGTIAAIVSENADQMPNQMRGTGKPHRIDTLKYLPALNNWTKVHSDVNEVNFDLHIHMYLRLGWGDRPMPERGFMVYVNVVISLLCLDL